MLPVAVADGGALTLSLLAQLLRTVLAPVGRDLDYEAFPRLLLLHFTALEKE